LFNELPKREFVFGAKRGNIMSHRALGAVALSMMLATTSFAADLPSKKAPAYLPPPPPPLWTGFYAGVNAGGTWSANNNISVATIPFSADPGSLTTAALGTGSLGANSGGFIGGGQIGYNYQFSPNFVVGIEADIDGVAGTRSTNSFANSGQGVFIALGFLPVSYVDLERNSASRSLDYLGTVRGRIGYLVTPTLLLYGTGGLAYGGANFSASSYNASSIFLNFNGFTASGSVFGLSHASISDTRVGWTAGGGLEWLFLPNWSAKVEYLYYDLGRVTLWSPIVEGAPGQAASIFGVSYGSTRFNGHIVRAGVNYHFDLFDPAPIVAKY
jgi:outer membrane immunogenic protein